MMKKQIYYFLLIGLLSSLSPSLLSAQGSSYGKWKHLFDVKTLKGCHLYNQAGEKINNWIIEDGALICTGTPANQPNGALVSDLKFENFEVQWEWKIDTGSNSGFFYHVQEGVEFKKGPQETGPEYQIIDDEHFPGKLEEWQKTGADYAMTIPNAQKKTKPIGKWNKSAIVYHQGKVKHYLNGKLILEFDNQSADWEKNRNSGKWKAFPNYAKIKNGSFALQDHHSRAYFRRIKVRVIKD